MSLLAESYDSDVVVDAEPSAPWTPSTPLAAITTWVEAHLSRLTASRHWALTTTGLSVALGVLLAFPSYGNFIGYAKEAQWQHILERTRGDFVSQQGQVVDSRAINLTWRVVPRLIGWVLHITEPWQYLVLQAFFGAVLLWTAALLVEELLGDRVLAALTTVGVASTWSAASAWVEVRGNFDAIAVAFTLLMMRARRPWWILLFGGAAVFTDERVYFVLPLVALFHLYRDRDVRDPTPWRDLLASETQLIGLLVVASIGVRHYFTWRLGLEPLSNT